jgi:nucleotide-binding universal stress UspA family protein
MLLNFYTYIGNMMFSKICLAVGSSPRTEALIAETVRLVNGFNAHLTILHVGESNTFSQNISEQIKMLMVDESRVRIIHKTGEPAQVILDTCKTEKIDLLVAGALQKENLLKFYLGTIGRTILRKAPCSVFVFTDPKTDSSGFEQIVALADDTPFIKETLTAACRIGLFSKTQNLHILREIKLFGLSLAATENKSESEYNELQHQLVEGEISEAERMIKEIPHENLKINFKVVTGKAGFEVSQFAHKKNANLLVVGAPERKFIFLDRFFKHDLEYLFADLPCNLLIVNPGKNKS